MHPRNPPGPKNFNAWLGLTWRHYAAMRWDPPRFFQQMAQRYGDLVFFRVFQHRMYLVNHPDLIRKLLVQHDGQLEKYERIMQQLRIATGDGLLTSRGVKWKQQRTILQRVFQARRITALGEITLRETERWLQTLSSDQRLPIEHAMTVLLQAIMAEGFFGSALSEPEQIAVAVRDASDIFYQESRALWRWPDGLPLPSKLRKRQALSRLRSLMAEVLARRGAATPQDESNLLSVLLRATGEGTAPGARMMSPEQAFAEALTLFVAGYHTTSVALAWIWDAIARRPVVQARLRQELQGELGERLPTVDDLDRLPYLEMVIKEALRLHPPAWELFARQTTAEISLREFVLPAGSLVLIVPQVVQRDPRFFQDPLRFDPERFGPMREAEVHPFSYIPFGAGPHVCIGKNLAMLQMKLIVAAVLQRFRVSCVAADPPPVRARVSARPKRDILLRFSARQPAAIPLLS